MPTRVARAYDQAAIVVPANNEQARLPACLRALLTAALCAPIPVVIVVVLDATDDDSAKLAGQYGPDVHFVSVDAGNVGTARAVGFRYARSLRVDGGRCWYATTDADSQVDPDWLVHQLRLGADMVLGVVRVDDWRHHSADFADHYTQNYDGGGDVDGTHAHVHGANMGFSAAAYWRVGGFRPLPSSEDVDLVGRFEASGYCIDRDPELSVTTSARSQARAPHGFADHLAQLEEAQLEESVQEGCA
jgi:glycosyltransferase involved in cell wall biosynthesis